MPVAELDDVQQHENAIQQKVQNWKPPKIGVGDSVVYFPTVTNRKICCPAEVVEVGQRTISLLQKGIGASAFYKYEVHHIDDPKLDANFDLRQYGAWDYSDQAKRFFAIEKELVTLRERVEELETKPKGK